MAGRLNTCVQLTLSSCDSKSDPSVTAFTPSGHSAAEPRPAGGNEGVAAVLDQIKAYHDGAVSAEFRNLPCWRLLVNSRRPCAGLIMVEILTSKTSLCRARRTRSGYCSHRVADSGNGGACSQGRDHDRLCRPHPKPQQHRPADCAHDSKIESQLVAKRLHASDFHCH